MNQELPIYGVIWIASEICYYLGLVLAFLFIPAITFILWMMSLVDQAEPNYRYILIAWILSVIMFLAGVGLKNVHYSMKNNQNGN